MLLIIDKIDIDEIEIKEKINIEINKYRQFSYIILGKETEFDNKQVEADTKKLYKTCTKKWNKRSKERNTGVFKE